MSGDLGSSIVVEACEKFMQSHQDVELYVTGKAEELEKLQSNERIHIVDARDIVPMDAGIMSVRRKKDSSMVKAVTLANDGIVDGVVSWMLERMLKIPQNNYMILQLWDIFMQKI